MFPQPVHIHGTVVGTSMLLECSICGPVGVYPAQPSPPGEGLPPFEMKYAMQHAAEHA